MFILLSFSDLELDDVVKQICLQKRIELALANLDDLVSQV